MSKLDTLLKDEDNIDLTLSYSRVSSFDTEGPSILLERTHTDSKALRTGSLIDDLLFDVQDEFRRKYHISQVNTPTATLGKLCEIILKNHTQTPSKDEVINIIKTNSFWDSTKNPALLEGKFDNEEFWTYLNDKFNCGEKIVISPMELDRANEIVHILRTHEYSKSIFDENLEHHYQYEFKVKIKQFYFRGILDILSIDHTKKIIYFKDLKTGAGPAAEFISSFIKYRYYIQEAVYRHAFEYVCKDFNLEGYTLAPFEFVYIGLKERIPICYVVTEKWTAAALEGFKIGSYKYRGLYQLTDEIYFHWKNKVYDLPMEIYTQKGKIRLKDDFIV